MPTVCFRGGCLTGSNHASAELHGFLAYLARCVLEGRTYRIYGYKGKQVRTTSTRPTSVRRRSRSPSAPAGRRLQHRWRPRELRLDPRGDRALEELTGAKLDVEYVDEPRRATTSVTSATSAVCASDYPGWDVTVTLDEILGELGRRP